MNFITWLKNKLNGSPVPMSGIKEFTEEYEQLVADVHIREMAFLTATNLMANALSKCEFKTFLKNAETKKQEYYLWNFEPNKNQNSSAFLRQLIYKLYRNNECLVVEQNGQLLIADDYEHTEYALYDDSFKKVTVKDFTFNKTFYQPDVLFFKLNEKNVRKVIDGLYQSYSRLISYTMNSYQKSRGTKGIFKYESIPVAGTPDREAFDQLIDGKFSKWLKDDNAALPLGRGQEWKENQSRTYSSEGTRDIKAMIDDIYDFTARGFNIPPVLMRGDLANLGDNVMNTFLTFAVDPLSDTLQEEIVRKRYGQADFMQGTYLEIDTRTIEHISILKVATAIDKLIASGSFCINDVRKLVGEKIIDEPWAWKHFITKNYTDVEDLDVLNKPKEGVANG